MQLNDTQLKELCELAKKAALSAGRIIRNCDRSSLNIDEKSGGENIASQVVTEIDHRAQAEILNHLQPNLEAYELGLLAEESNDDGSRFKRDYFWCIDPLDGTLCFSRNEDGYSVAIALVAKDGTPIIGIVYDPRHDDLYSAIKDKGAYIGESEFKLKENANELTLLYDQSFLKIPNYLEEMEMLKEQAQKNGLKGVRKYHLGGAIMNGISTIKFAPAIYYKHPKESLGGGSIWDFAASSVIQREAGGFNSNYYGQALDLNREDSSFMNHQGVIFKSHQALDIK
tara:strand:- start:236106 stop:236957 length:852 start_codon:yes stop_codon:yes gene_type:complete